MSDLPVRAVITGGPGAGKSTLLAALARQGIVTFPEVARAILKAPGGMDLRAQQPEQFALAMLEAELSAWHAAPAGLSIYDRGFPDIAGFLNLEGRPVPASIDQACRMRRYNGPVFHAPPWRAIYAQDAERTQSWQEAQASGLAVAQAWRAYGYRLIELPRTSVDARLAFVMEHLAADLASPRG